MVIVELTGGLGNQLFQYASAKRLALRHNVELKISPNFKNDIARQYKLKYFDISERIATENEIHKLTLYFKSYNQLKNKIYRKLQLLKPHYKRRVYTEKLFENDLGLLKASQNVYLIGNWANGLFFREIKGELLEILKLKPKFQTQAFLNYKLEIENSNSISVHIRRGDYVTSEAANNLLGVLSHDYYNRAITLLEERLSNFTLYIFSDDIEYVKRNFNFNAECVFIKHNDIQDYHELILMSYCKHNVIANSTFSWWGAWLNKNEKKLIIAPQKWYNDQTVQEYHEEHSFIPNSWTLL